MHFIKEGIDGVIYLFALASPVLIRKDVVVVGAMRYDKLLDIRVAGHRVGNGSTCPGVVASIYKYHLLLGGIQVLEEIFYHLSIIARSILRKLRDRRNVILLPIKHILLGNVFAVLQETVTEGIGTQFKNGLYIVGPAGISSS